MGMSPFIEFEDKNLEGAITKACETLNIPREQLKHEVVSFGASGIFGLVGFKKARIRVSIPEIQEMEPINQPDEAAVSVSSDDSFTVLDDTTADTISDLHPIYNVDDASSLHPSHIEKSAEIGRQFLQRLVDSITSDAEIAVTCCSQQIIYTINGGNPASIIGKRGQTFEAIRYLIKKIINKSAEARIRVIVEIAGHTSKRIEDLQTLAKRFAENACRNGKAVSVGRFSPQDRKIIHLALKNDIRIKTQSKGEGYLKKLIVIPRGE